MLTRRNLLAGAGGVLASSFALAGYAVAVEPKLLLARRYAIAPAGWPQGLRLRIAAIADLHACDPWMTLDMIERIVAETNELGADVIALLGDYETINRYTEARIPMRAWTEALGRLRAPLGVHAVLGNHDWWQDPQAMRREQGPVVSRRALEDAGVPVYENDAVRLVKDGAPFWIAGLGDQWAFYRGRRRRRVGPHTGYRGVDDLPGALARVRDEAPVILLAHEPDIFPKVPARVSLTLCGHTHGGQIRLMGYSPVIPSMYGQRYAYGHVVEEGRHLVVSGGLGCSGVPVRIGVPPEIVVVDLGVEV
ncbi:MAG TPA: metallophosphoesterase [Hyphomicrobiaceae bacterium]|nr:metallophosphoesterase [Hyphomicrobiaceae bacterium]